MSRFRAVLLDVDGTLLEGGRPVPGADRAVAFLRREGIPFRLATNTTRMPRRLLARRLAGCGIEVRAEEILSAPRAAAWWLAARGRRRVLPLLPEATLEDLEGLEVVEAEAEAVLVGDLGAAWTFEVLQRAFRELLEGAELVAVQRNRWWDPGDGPVLDAGPFVAALEYAAGASATLVGKPSPPFFRAAAERLGVEPGEILVVGDSPENDVAGAVAAGLRTALVRTGRGRAADPARLDPRPELVLDSVADLPTALGLAPPAGIR